MVVLITFLCACFCNNPHDNYDLVVPLVATRPLTFRVITSTTAPCNCPSDCSHVGFGWSQLPVVGWLGAVTHKKLNLHASPLSTLLPNEVLWNVEGKGRIAQTLFPLALFPHHARSHTISIVFQIILCVIAQVVF